jgi:hypothetical protein
MSIEMVPGTALRYYLIAFDADGHERTDDPDGLMSQRAVAVLGQEPITDVFVISHGWKGDVPAAREQYNNWIGAMARCEADLAQVRQARPPFQPLLIALHWPSLPWGEEELGAAAMSFDPAAATPVAQLIDQYAERLANTAATRAALDTIFTAALEDIAPSTLPQAVRDAYQVLDREATLASAGAGAAPGADREPFDPERAFQNAQAEAGQVNFGWFSVGGLLSPLRQLSFWKMKDRARQFGETGGFTLLRELQRAVTARRDVRCHLIGHSFGCIVVSAILAGSGGHGILVRPVDSVALLQGALSLWSYCADIPVAPGQRGYFHSIIAEQKVKGPIITTQSEFDTAVGRFYPLGAGVRRQITFAPGELPTYGGLGTFGIRGLDEAVVDLDMLPVSASYTLAPGKIYNLESSRFICEGSGASGAHSDIAKPEVAHAVWAAVRD